MTLGLTPKQGDLLRSTVGYCEGRVAADSIYGVLQRIEGCSDREAVDRFAFDARWKYAAGALAVDYLGHMMRRRHGGRRARVRGQTKVAADFSLLAAATNLARFGVPGLTWVAGPGWAVAPS